MAMSIFGEKTMKTFEIIINNTSGSPLLPKVHECVGCRGNARADGRKNVCYSTPVEHSMQTAKCAKCGLVHLVFNVRIYEHLAVMHPHVELSMEHLHFEPVVWLRDGLVSP